MAARDNRMPHLGVLAAGHELARYAEVTRQRAHQLTSKDWWTIEPIDYIGGRFIYSYPDAVRLLTEHGYPKRLHGNVRVLRRRVATTPATPTALAARRHRGVLAGIGEIARFANVPTSRATAMTTEDWWTVAPLDHLAGGTVYPCPAVRKLLTERGYPHKHLTIGERLEMGERVSSRRAG